MSIKRILIVDDEHLTRISLAGFLHDAGYETAAASNGESAIQLQREQPFDLCIVDIRMPGIDGVETILRMNRIASNSRFIICTGSPQFTLTPALKEINMSERHIVRKPILDMNIFVTLIDDPDFTREMGSFVSSSEQKSQNRGIDK